MGTQSSRVDPDEQEDAQQEREESPLLRASDEENAFEDKSLYAGSRANGGPRSPSTVPNGLPAATPDARTKLASYPDGLPRYLSQPPPAAQPIQREHSPSPVKPEPEENLQHAAHGNSDTRAFRAVNIKRGSDQLVERGDEDDILYEQSATSASHKRRNEGTKKSRKSKKKKVARRKQTDPDDEEQLLTPDVTDSLVSADDFDAPQPEGDEDDATTIVQSDLLPLVLQTKGRKKKTKDKRRTPLLDLEDDPILESQEVDVPASFQPPRKRKQTNEHDTRGQWNASKKRKVSAPPEPVEEIDDPQNALEHDDEVIENTQEKDVARPPSPNLVESKPGPAMDALQLNTGAPADLDLDDFGSDDLNLGTGPEGEDDGDRLEPAPHHSHALAKELAQRPPPMALLGRSPNDAEDGSSGDDTSVNQDDEVVPSLSHPVQRRGSQSKDDAPEGGPSSTRLSVNDEVPSNDEAEDENHTTTILDAPVQHGQLGDEPMTVGGGTLSGGEHPDSSLEKKTGEQPMRGTRRLSFIRTLARRPKNSSKSPQRQTSQDAAYLVEDLDPNGVNSNEGTSEQLQSGINDGLDLVQDSSAVLTATAPPASQTHPSRAKARRRPKIPYFEREEEEMAKASAETPRHEAAASAQKKQPQTPRATDHKSVGNSSRARKNAGDSNQARPTPSSAPSLTDPPRVPGDTVENQSRSGSRAPTSVAREEEPNDQEETTRKARASPKPRVGALTQQEENQVIEAVEVFMQERAVTMEDMIRIIQDNPKNGTVTHRQLWVAVEKACPTRKRQKLIDWCRKRYHAFVARGIWTPEQDEELGQKVQEHGTKWAVIAKEINRHPNDVRDRYRNYVACGPNRNKDYWQEDEEDRLREVVSQCLKAIDAVRSLEGNEDDTRTNEECLDWNIVSQKMNRTRSRRQCLQKWKQLRETNDIGHCADVIGPGYSWRLDRARKELRSITPQDKFSLVNAIQKSGASRDAKISWKDVANSLSDKQFQKATLAVCWGRLKRTVPGWESQKTAACAEYLCKEYEADGTIEVGMDDSDADEEQEERIVATLTPGSVGQRHSIQPFPSSARSTDRERVHRTPREYLFSDSPHAVVGSAPINRNPRAKAPAFTNTASRPRVPSSSISQPHTGTSRARPTSVLPNTQSSPTAQRSKPRVSTPRAKPAKHRRAGLSEERALSTAAVAPGDSESEELEETPRATTRVSHGDNDAEDINAEEDGGLDDALEIIEIDDQESVDLGLEGSREGSVPSEGPESVDLSLDVGHPAASSSRDESLLHDSILGHTFNGRTYSRASRKGKGKQSAQTAPISSNRSVAELYSSQKRSHSEEDSDANGEARAKRARRKSPSEQGEPNESDDIEQEEIPESDVEGERSTGKNKGIAVSLPKSDNGRKTDEKVTAKNNSDEESGSESSSESSLESSSEDSSEASSNGGRKLPKIVTESDSGARAAAKPEAEDGDGQSSSSAATSDSSDSIDEEDDSESDSASDALTANGSKNGKTIADELRSPSLATSAHNYDVTSDDDGETESNMDDMDDIPAWLPGMAQKERPSLFVDDEAEEEDEVKSSEEDEEEVESSEEDEEDRESEFEGFGDDEQVVDPFQSDSDDDYED